MRHVRFAVYISTMSKVVVSYIGLMLFPLTLHMERIVPLSGSVFNPQAAISLVAILCVILFSALIYKRGKELFFFICFFAITLLPMSNILTINAFMAEHWLYIPSIGFYSIVSFGVTKALDLKRPFFRQSMFGRAATLVLVCFLGFCLIRTTLRNIEWGQPVQFYKDMVRHSPRSARGRVNLGSIYLAREEYKMARRELEAAVLLNPIDPSCYHVLGILDYLEDRKPAAMKKWKKVLDMYPFYRPTLAAMNKALYSDNRRFRKLLRAARIKPKGLMAHYRISKVYLDHGLYIEAMDRLDTALGIDPKYADAVFNRAWIYSKLGIYSKAIKEYDKAIVLTPDDPDIYRNLSFCYRAMGKHKTAEAMRKKAGELDIPR
ncbi:MAG: tetratricopeptide repeat protein [Candidatus Omnitrophica bacterium]|nr:tetratricopeptide repeat protein [Candidatus Omnitrophota bacterium]